MKYRSLSSRPMVTKRTVRFVTGWEGERLLTGQIDEVSDELQLFAEARLAGRVGPDVIDQVLLELLLPVMNPVLDVAHPGAQRPGDVVVREPLELVQDERFVVS